VRLGRVFGAEVTVNPALAGLLAVAAVAGELPRVTLAILFLTAHELAHMAAAGPLRFKPRAVEITPFGGVITLNDDPHLRPSAELGLALAGPLANLLLGALAALLRPLGFVDPSLASFAVWCNVGLAVVNLLPAPPLDGGRAMCSIVARSRGERAAARAARLGSATVILVLTLAGLSLPLLGGSWLGVSANLWILAVFLYAARRRDPGAAGHLFWRRLREKRKELAAGKALAVSLLMVREDESLLSLVDRFLPGRYHLVAVVDGDLNLIGMAGESETVRALTVFGSTACGRDLLREMPVSILPGRKPTLPLDII
jgi:stage IV sporulation protein FB